MFKNMNFNTSPIAFFTSRAAQIWRAWFAQRKISVICGNDLLPFYIIDNGQAPSGGELYDPNTDVKVADIDFAGHLLDHDITVDGQTAHIWIYQGEMAGVFGRTNPGYYYLKIGSWYSDVFRIGDLSNEYTEISWQFFDDIITADGTPISKHIKYRQIFETPLWHPEYNIEEEGKTNNGIFYAMQQTTKKTSGFNAIVNESQIDCLNLTRMADNITVKACLNGTVKTMQTNQFEITSKWESDDVASIECKFDLFAIIRKYQQSNVEPEPLPLPTPPTPPTNYKISGKTQSGVTSIKLNINGTIETIAVTNGAFEYGYDSQLTSLRTSVDSGNLSPDTPLQNCDKITELDFSESCGLETATSVVLNSLTNCTKIDLTDCTFAAVTSIKKMFDSDKALTAINMQSATFASVTQGSLMFADCVSLTSVKMPNATLKIGAYGMFTGCKELKEIDLRACTFEDETTTANMFYGCKKLGQSAFRFDAATFASVTSCAYMFASAMFYGKTAFSQLFPNWAAEPTNCEAMFQGANTDVVMNLAFDTSYCTNMRWFLENTTRRFEITTLDMSAAANLEGCFKNHVLAGEDTYDWLATQTFAAATNTNSMFKGSFESHFFDPTFTAATFALVTDAESMFEGCTSEKIDLQNATFAALETATNMFSGCTDLENVDLSAATFANVTNASGMFYNCTNLQSVSVPASATMPVSFGLAQSADLTIQSFSAFSNWVADKSGQESPTATFNSTARQNWSANSYVAWTLARTRFITKNWTLQG